MNFPAELWTPLTATIVAIISGIVAWLMGRRKADADISGTLIKNFDAFSARLNEDNRALRADVVHLRETVLRLEATIDRMSVELGSARK